MAKAEPAKKGGKDEGPSADDIMSSGAIKSELAKAKRGDPVNCAIVLTKDKDAVLLVDKRKAGKKLRSELKSMAADVGLELDMGTMRFGKASVDTEQDAGLVSFKVNKEAPGAMTARLRDRVKTCGFQKVEIVVDGGLEDEAEEEEGEQKAGGKAGAGGGGETAALAEAAEKAEQIWSGYIKRWATDFDKFEAAAQAAFKDHAGRDEVADFVQTHIMPIMGQLTDHALEDKLRLLQRNKDPAGQQKLLSGAMDTIKELESFIASHPMIHELGDNPFHPIKVGDAAASVLAAVKKSLEKLDH